MDGGKRGPGDVIHLSACDMGWGDGVVMVVLRYPHGGLRHCQRLLGISQILAWACKKVVSDLGLDSGFRWVIRFPHQLQLAKHDLAAILQKR